MTNKGKRVCIIRSNPVRPDSRVEKEAWSLSRAGYDVHILAWDRDSNHQEEKENIVIAGEKIPITRLGYKASFGEGFKNIIPYLKFQCHMRKWLRVNEVDIVHACDFDTAFFSLDIVKRKKRKFVFDIFDFLFGEPHNFFEQCVKWAQYRIINEADVTIICTEDRQKQIQGSHPRKLAIIHNTPSSNQSNKKECEKKNDEIVKVAYVGILQDYRLLMEVANCIIGMQNVELHIGGFGKYENYFSELAVKNSRIKFYGRLQYEQTLELEKNCDIMLAIYDPKIENHKYAAPNKFYESLMLGKPVIMVKGTGMSKIVEENHIGVLIEYSEKGFALGLKELIERREEWKEMENKMHMLYDNYYSWSIMEKRLLEVYSFLTSGPI